MTNAKRTISCKALVTGIARPVIKGIFYFWVLPVAFFNSPAGPRDTARKRTIDITSTFKPVLKDAVKINFHAGPVLADTSHHALTYSIPSQFLFLSYQPAELKTGCLAC